MLFSLIVLEEWLRGAQPHGELAAAGRSTPSKISAMA